MGEISITTQDAAADVGKEIRSPEPVSGDAAVPIRAGRLQIRPRPGLVVGVLLSSDLIMLAGAAMLAVYGRIYLVARFDPQVYLRLWPMLGLFIAAYGAFRLYPALPLSPAEELRRLTMVTSLIYLGLGTMTFMFKEASSFSRADFVIAWLLTLLLVPLGRASLRMVLSPRCWWGYPVVVLGGGQAAHRLVRTLRRHAEIGLKPVAVLADDVPEGQTVMGVKCIGSLDRFQMIGGPMRVRHAVVALEDLDPQRVEQVVERLDDVFKHVTLVPAMSSYSTLWVAPVDLKGLMGLEVRHRLLDPGRRALKRLIDLLLIVGFAPLWLGLMLLIAVAIKLDSRGPVFFRHERIGEGGRRFMMLKFRTMKPNADRILRRFLMRHPELRAEWERTHKLKHDPRLTRVGWLLRRTSLDELPQILNVLRGQMSLVGPRPIIDEEVEKYGRGFKTILKVKPGITGLWQVSGRNNLTYEERVQLDVYYVRNWSVWLDIYLLSRTALAVLLCRGAY